MNTFNRKLDFVNLQRAISKSHFEFVGEKKTAISNQQIAWHLDISAAHWVFEQILKSSVIIEPFK